MENQKNSNQDCGCGDGCCTPQKMKSWQRWIFIAIILAAVAIVTVKLINKDDTQTEECCPTTDCCPQSN